MARPIKDRHLAIERLAEKIPEVSLEDAGRGSYRIHVEGTDLAPTEKSSKKTLAYLAEMAKVTGVDQEEIMREVNWVGRVPSRGLSGYQRDALLWLQGSSVFG